MKHFKALTIASALCISIMMCGCDTEDVESKPVNTQLSTQAAFDINSNDLEDAVDKFIKGDVVSGTTYFNETIKNDIEDMYFNYEIVDKYANKNSVYFKIKSDGVYMMFRFQIGTDGKIESYIKYTLEE